MKATIERAKTEIELGISKLAESDPARVNLENAITYLRVVQGLLNEAKL